MSKAKKDEEVEATPFGVKDCALVAIATGKKAQNLRELRDKLENIHPSSIYYHFWGGMLRPQFIDPEYNNDFAAWAQHGLNDARLAERLGAIIPTEFHDLEALRLELHEVIEERLDESEFVPWSKVDQQFYFMRSQIVVFDTHHVISDPLDMEKIFPQLSLGSVFYHFIDARRRFPVGMDDFSVWLGGCGSKYQPLIDTIAAVDPYFSTLTDARNQISSILADFFRKKR